MSSVLLQETRSDQSRADPGKKLDVRLKSGLVLTSGLIHSLWGFFNSKMFSVSLTMTSCTCTCSCPLDRVLETKGDVASPVCSFVFYPDSL